uniref:Uncharacterized protein n=1 Tax=Cyclopterus lumpus TaxID=8103 RepID=A0A8C2WRA4_CYCLU
MLLSAEDDQTQTKACLHCHGMNAANRTTCQSCFAGLSIKERIKLKEESLRSGDWGGKVKEHRNAGRVVDSARISVKNLHELDFKPLLFMGRERRFSRGEIIKRMTALYEYFLRSKNTAFPSHLEEPLPVLNLVPVEHPPPTAPPSLSSPLPTHSLSSPPTTPSLPSPPPTNPSLSSPPTTPSLSIPITLSLSSPPPATPSNAPLPSPVKGLMRMKKELLGKRKISEHTGLTYSSLSGFPDHLLIQSQRSSRLAYITCNWTERSIFIYVFDLLIIQNALFIHFEANHLVCYFQAAKSIPGRSFSFLRK